ncbi:unnamed protein product [Linum trigynum]|uniref:Uncharacterized protein n=1 Tax=Linum trigynum TaxID=586398 RepID=A0AAV2ENW1_9ROSI
MRVALSSLFELGSRLGRLLFCVVVVVLRASLLNQMSTGRTSKQGDGEDSRAQSVPTENMGAKFGTRMDRGVKRGLRATLRPTSSVRSGKKRKHRDGNGEISSVPKKHRVSKIKGWRFWLPSPSDLEKEVSSHASVDGGWLRVLEQRVYAKYTTRKFS